MKPLTMHAVARGLAPVRLFPRFQEFRMSPRHALAALLFVAAASAQAQPDATAQPPLAEAPANAWTEGEVRKVDKAQGKLTLRHGPIVNLQMPAMSMVFRAADPALLAAVREGDKVRFVADQVNGVFTVRAIEALK